MYPFNTPYNRFGNEMLPIRGAPNRGPGCYNNEEVCISNLVNFVYKLGELVHSRNVFRKENTVGFQNSQGLYDP